MYEAWLKIVEIYSRCSVTFSKDKLVALAGVARVAGNESGDDYLAGLWRSKMEEMLCWVPAFRKYLSCNILARQLPHDNNCTAYR